MRNAVLARFSYATRRRGALFWSIVAGGTCIAIFIFGPGLIHVIYRAATSDTLISRRRAEYNRLENGESSLNWDERLESVKARYRLWQGFHARGLGIDEGGDEHGHDSIWCSL